MPDPLQHIVQLALLATIGPLLALQLWLGPLRPEARKPLLAVMAVLSAVSVGAYFRMGQLHGYGKFGNHSYHYHDIYHYAIGAKYYPELGYERIYSCTWVALIELREDGVKVPQITELRDLSAPNTFYDPRPRRAELSTDCHDRFSHARWASFRGDLKNAWLDAGWDQKWWTVMLRDMGFNPPPSWSAVGTPLANLAPLNAFTLEAWPYFDVLLIFGVGGAMVWWAFGPWALLAYFTVLGTNWIASYRWTGGSFCRQLWFAFLVWGVCLLQLRRWASAGVALGMAVSMRLFPVLFVFGALLALVRAARSGPEGKGALIRFTTAGVLTGAAMLGLSLILFDAALWPEFLDKMRHHGNTFFIWHVGFKKWAVYVPELILDPKVYAQPGMTRVEAFQLHLNGLYDAGRWLYDPFRLALMGAAGWLAWRRTPAQATWTAGAVLLFCLSMPANYYWVFLALFPVVFMERGGWPAIRMAAFFAMLFSLSISTWIGQPWLVQNGWINRSILAFLVVFLGTLALEGMREQGREPPPPV